MKTILITGAGGYLGSNLIEQLSKEDKYQIFAFDLFKEKLKDQFKHIRNIEFFDSIDLDLGSIPFNETDVIIHLAFARAHKGEIEIAKSLVFTDKFFNEVWRYKIPALINISTQEVYGNKYSPSWHETLIPAPNTLYGLAKFSSEILAKNLNSQGHTDATSLRLAGVIGQDTDSRLVSRFVDNVLKGLTIKIMGGGQLLSQIDVRDAVSGIASLLRIPSSVWKSTYNLGYIRSYSIFEIVELVIEKATLFGLKNIKVVQENSDIELNAVMDSTLFYTDTHWQPKYSMGSTIESIFEYKINSNLK
ncbi:MAG: NAD(P)-dependent oxidoreductase [Bacteroidales bacterium]|nr:NAD(P)-dependent oxidoreductase [Bacteroidales bacterium]